MFKSKFSLRHLNKFQVESVTDKYFSFTKDEELSELKNYNLGDNYLILGGGSNILLPCEFSGVVIQPKSQKIEIIEKSKQRIIVRSDAGLDWDEFVAITIKHGWQGLENLTSIPGSVGASPVQNIGAYGAEVSELIANVNCYDLKNHTFLTLSNQECEFSYRQSIFKRRPELLVLSVEFILMPKPFTQLFANRSLLPCAAVVVKEAVLAVLLILKSIRIGTSTSWKLKVNFEYLRQFLGLSIISPTIKRVMVKYIRKKTMPDPKNIGNNGCFFKSPVVEQKEAARIKLIDPAIKTYEDSDSHLKVSAGDLIKSCGWAGRRIGNVSIDKNRPLVILNHGQASSIEILNFSLLVQSSVTQKFQLKIEPEVVIVAE
ncbi:FAD-binding protein [Pseudomonas sp. BIC9C]|uniref:FAD-binding protein n=1 Tax=Pseudomonas sp. BIC9C TaxID=3078458 RepID=UPI002AD237FF|nr:FAD-binding protein [Pseudomonas sp. BIC9C]